jgi:hypothetical protein
MLNPKPAFFYKISFLFFTALVVFGCASMQNPGRPARPYPAKIIEGNTGQQNQEFFNAKEINVEFDEFFKLTTQYQEISMSPAHGKTTGVLSKKKPAH